MMADWVMVAYLVVGVSIEALRWPQDREFRAALARGTVKRRTRRPDWRSQLRRQLDPGYTEEARARDDVRAYVAGKVLLWPVFLLADAAAWLAGVVVLVRLRARGRR